MDDGLVEVGKIASHGGPDAARPDGAELDDASRDNGVLGEKEFVVSVDGVEKVSANWLPVTHRKVFVDAQGERGPSGKRAAFGLA